MNTPVGACEIHILAEYVVEAHSITQAQETNIDYPTHSSAWLNERHAHLAELIAQHEVDHPGSLEKLRSVEEARVAAAVGMLAVLPEQDAAGYNAGYRSETERMLGRGLAILAHVKIASEPVEPVEQPLERKTPALIVPERLEQPEESVYTLIDSEGRMSINGKVLDLLPVQRVVVDYLIEHDEPFKLKTLYNSIVFKQAVEQANQTSPLPTALNNAVNGIERQLRKLNLELDDLMYQVGGTPRNRVFKRNPNLIVDDRRILEQAPLVADSLLDELHSNKPVLAANIVARFFGVERLSVRHKPVLELALSHLSEHLKDAGLVVNRDDSRITLELNEETPEDEGAAEDEPSPSRGKFVELRPDAVVFENETIELTNNEQALVEVIRGTGLKGATKAHLENFFNEKRLSGSSFEEEFIALRQKLGYQLERKPQGGKTRYILRKKPRK